MEPLYSWVIAATYWTGAVTAIVKHYSKIMVEWYEILGINLPENGDSSKSISKDKVVRELDCTLIEFMHWKF